MLRYMMAARTRLEDNPYIVALSLAEVGRGSEAVAKLRNLEEKIQTRMRDFMMAARTMIEGDSEGSIAAVGRIVASAFSDPEGLLYLTRTLEPNRCRIGALRACSRRRDLLSSCHVQRSVARSHSAEAAIREAV